MITTHPYSARHGGDVVGCSLERPRTDGDSKTRQVAQREKRQTVREIRSAAEGNLDAVPRHAGLWAAGDRPHVAALRRLPASSSTGVDNSRSRSLQRGKLSGVHMISEARCRAKLHGVFSDCQRQSKSERFFLRLGVHDQLFANQIACLSSLGVVILSDILSPGFDLASPVVRDVLHSWSAHGDAWIKAEPQASTAVCLLEACQQAGAVGCFAGLSTNVACQSLVRCVHKSSAAEQ